MWPLATAIALYYYFLFVCYCFASVFTYDFIENIWNGIFPLLFLFQQFNSNEINKKNALRKNYLYIQMEMFHLFRNAWFSTSFKYFSVKINLRINTHTHTKKQTEKQLKPCWFNWWSWMIQQKRTSISW